MIKLGITGNIACGKNLVGKYLQELGCPVIDSDETIHHILSTKNPLTERLVELCQGNIITTDKVGESNLSFIDRAKLGKLLFADPQLRAAVEAILHPACYEITKQFFLEKAESGAKVSANLVPLLYEKGLESRYDSVWLIYCDPEIQRERLRERNPQLSEREITQRIEAQMPQRLKREKANYVIDNSGSREETYAQVQLAWKNFK